MKNQKRPGRQMSIFDVIGNQDPEIKRLRVLLAEKQAAILREYQAKRRK